MNKLFYLLSGTDQELIARCGTHSRIQQAAKGALVLVAGVLATVSMMYAMLSLPVSLPLAIISGITFGLVIISLDRLLVSAATKSSALLALLFAILIGLTLSIPLELRIFDKSIQAELVKEPIAEKEMRIRELEGEIKDTRSSLENLQKELIAEATGEGGTGRAGQGRAYEQKLKIYEDYKAQSEQRITQLSIEIDRIKREGDALRVSRSGDFLSRVEALRRVQQASPAALWTTWALRLLLILTQATPALAYLLEGKNEYSALLHKQWTYQPKFEPRQRVASSTNVRLPIPTFGRGFASAIDWTGALAPSVEELRGQDQTPEEADAAALAGDWEMVGRDLKKVLNKYGPKSTRQAA
jgi:hypothetical protein